PGEIATLLAVPQNPALRFPCEENVARLRAARNSIAKRLIDAGALGRGEAAARVSADALLAQIEASSVPPAMKPFPREAPHAAEWLRATTRKTRIRTTLDPGVQRLAERVMGGARRDLARKGIWN